MSLRALLADLEADADAAAGESDEGEVGGDVDDVVAMPDDVDLEQEAHEVNAAAARAHLASGKRNPIYITDDESVLVDASIAALAQRGAVYQRGGELVVVRLDDESKVHQVKALTVPGVRRELSRAAAFFKSRGKKKPRAVNVPSTLPGMVHTAGDFPGIRTLRGISPVPIVHADGTVFCRPGEYDPVTLMAYCPTRTYPAIPARVPTIAEARAAAAEVCQVFEDFPFQTEADKAAVLALILTLAGRHLVDGPTPAFVVNANVPGAGKGKVIETAVAIALGVEVAIMTPTDDDGEDRKQITACLRSGDRVIAFDNVRTFGGAVWDGLLTSNIWSGRNLGKTEQLKLPARAVVTVTANGARLVGDAGRRVLPIRLHTDSAHPELRAGFKATLPRDAIAGHPQLFARVVEIMRFGLSLSGPVTHWGSYESWCQIVRRTVTVVMEDPCATRAEIKDADETLNTLLLLLSTLIDLGAGTEWTATELVKASRPRRDHEGKVMEPGNDALAEALAAVVGNAERVDSQRVGAALRAHRDRRVEMRDGSRACLTMRMLDGRPRWSVKVDPATSPSVAAQRPDPPEGEPDLGGGDGQ